MSTIKSWLKYISKHNWEITVYLCIIFFTILIIFNKPITKWMKTKEDIQWFKPLNINKKINSYRIGYGRKKNESRCREIFEQIFQKPFPSIRPKFLERSNKRRLELDGYNEELKIAFEYNGIQHYKMSALFHRSIRDFEQQIQRDIDKREMCKKAGVLLISIPYTVTFHKLEKYIKEKISHLDIM
jgi:hypothetical protein